MPLQDANPTPSFGGFGVRRTFMLNSDTPVAQHASAIDNSLPGKQPAWKASANQIINRCHWTVDDLRLTTVNSS